MIVLDTNVLVYAVGEHHPLREASRAIVDALGDRRIEGTTTELVLQEFLHVFGRRRSRSVACAAARRYVALLRPLLHADEGIVRAAIDLFDGHQRLDAADALLAAAVLREPEADALVTADCAFADVPGLRVLDPRSPELARMPA